MKLLVLIIFQSLAGAREKFEHLTDVSGVTSDCSLLATALYVAIDCPDKLSVYTFLGVLDYQTSNPHSAVHKTLGNGISFVQEAMTLHHYNSFGDHLTYAKVGDENYFITNSISLTRNEQQTYVRFLRDNDERIGAIIFP